MSRLGSLRVGIWVMLLLGAAAWTGFGWIGLVQDRKANSELHASLPHGFSVERDSDREKQNAYRQQWRDKYHEHIGIHQNRIIEGVGLFAAILSLPLLLVVRRHVVEFRPRSRSLLACAATVALILLMLALSFAGALYAVLVGAAPHWSDSLGIPLFHHLTLAKILVPAFLVVAIIAVALSRLEASSPVGTLGWQLVGVVVATMISLPHIVLGCLALTYGFTAIIGPPLCLLGFSFWTNVYRRFAHVVAEPATILKGVQ